MSLCLEDLLKTTKYQFTPWRAAGTVRTIVTVLFSVMFEFCKVTSSGETSCPGEINGCFLGVYVRLHMSVRSTFISQGKPASVTLIDTRLCDDCQASVLVFLP